MKKLLLLFLFVSVGLNAQFNYQAIVKDSNGNPVTNNQVKFKFSLMYQSSTATPVYVEEHTVSTPPDGVNNLSVGGGTVVNGTFSNIDWSNSVFMKEELDTGSGYQDMGTRQIASVPVAEFAKSLSGFESDEMLDNIRIGDGALLSITSASGSSIASTGNIAIGKSALSSNTTGNSNISIGIMTLKDNIQGFANTGIGSYAGTSLISGTLNTAIGYRSDISNNLTNATAIGANSIVTTSNTIQLGDSNVTQINTSGVVSATDFILSGDSVGNILGSLSSTQSDIASLSSQIDALLAAVDDLDIQTNSLSSTLSESNTSEIKSAQVVITSNDVVLFELGVLRFSWNNTYNTIQVKQSSTSEIVDNWFISGVIRSGGSDGEYTPTEKYIQKTNMTYGIGDDGGGNDFFTPIWNNGPSSLMGGSIALGSGYSNFEFYITPMGSGSTPPYDPAPTWQLRGHVDGYNQLTVTCVHVKFDGTSGW
jgi:hypothetical protein